MRDRTVGPTEAFDDDPDAGGARAEPSEAISRWIGAPGFVERLSAEQQHPTWDIGPGELRRRVPGQTQRSGGPGGSAGVGAEAHFLRRLRYFDEDALADPLLEPLFPREEFLESCRHYGDPTLAEVARAVETGRVAYPRAIAGGFLQKLRLWTLLYDVEEEDIPLHFGTPIPIGELHCPRVPGCKTKVERTETRERELKLDVRIGALGGSRAVRKEVTAKSAVETSGPCVQLGVEVSGSVDRWRHLDTGEEIFLLSITGISDYFTTRTLADDGPEGESHVCAQEHDLGPYLRAIRARRAVINEAFTHIPADPGARAGVVNKGSIAMAQERVFEAQWFLATGETTHGIGTVTVSSRWKHTVEWGFEFPAGPEYLGQYPSGDRWPLQWAWSRAGQATGTPQP